MPSESSSIGCANLPAAAVWMSDSVVAGRTRQSLSDAQRARLPRMASIVQFKKGEQVYSRGEVGKAILNIIDGVIKIYNATPHGECIFAFLYAEDLFGLTEYGLYVSSAEAITPVTAYELPLEALQHGQAKDGDLAFHVIEKLCHSLRRAQHHAALLAERHALSKLAIFLQLQERIEFDQQDAGRDIFADEPFGDRRLCRHDACCGK